MVGDEDCIVVETNDFWKEDENSTNWRDYGCCINERITGVLCQMPGNSTALNDNCKVLIIITPSLPILRIHK